MYLDRASALAKAMAVRRDQLEARRLSQSRASIVGGRSLALATGDIALARSRRGRSYSS